MYVEFLGLTGSGKSTLCTTALAFVRNKGIKARRLHRYMNEVAARESSNGKWHRKDDESLKRHRQISLWEACVDYPEFTANAFHASSSRPRLHAGFARAILAWSELQKISHEQIFLTNDEGLLYRGATAHWSAGDPAAFQRFLEIVPLPDLLVHIDISVAEARRRTQTRRRPQAIPDGVDAETHLSEMAALLTETARAARRRGAQVLTVDATDTPESAAERIARQAASILNQS